MGLSLLLAREADLAAIICALHFGGETEVRHPYVAQNTQHYIRVDCETDTHVIEIGLDGSRGSMDSLHQALFAASLTGKEPMIVIIDRNAEAEAVEWQVRETARAAGVAFLSIDRDRLIRWQMTEPFRQRAAAIRGDGRDDVTN